MYGKWRMHVETVVLLMGLGVRAVRACEDPWRGRVRNTRGVKLEITRRLCVFYKEFSKIPRAISSREKRLSGRFHRDFNVYGSEYTSFARQLTSFTVRSKLSHFYGFVSIVVIPTIAIKIYCVFFTLSRVRLFMRRRDFFAIDDFPHYCAMLNLSSRI